MLEYFSFLFTWNSLYGPMIEAWLDYDSLDFIGEKSP